MRLIDADELLTKEHQHYDYLADEWLVPVRDIENAPTIEERKKGKWILSDEQREEDVSNGNYQFYCSECGHGDLQSKSVTVSFCWNCGARMNYEETGDAKIH